MGWVKGDDGLLARDLDSNGTIDDISELFGSNDENGFEALQALDTNDDGFIDSNDTGFADLRVWQDANQDAITDAGELKSLSQLGIVSFALPTIDSSVSINAGNEVTLVSEYTLSDGSIRTSTNVSFAVNNGVTIIDPNGDPNDPNDPDNNPGGEGEDADRAFVSIAAGNGGDDTFFPGLANALLDGGEGDDTFEIRYERTDLVDGAIAAGFQNVSTATLDKQMASLIGGVGDDIARYTQADTGTQLALSFSPVVDQLAQDRLTGGTFFKLESDDTENLFAEIETIELSAESDELTVEEALAQKIGDGSTIDGGNAASQGTTNATLADKLDFSTSTDSVYIKDADNGSASAEVYASYDPVTVSGLRVFNVFIPAGDPKGDGLTDPTGLMFANFEYVKGSAHDDVLGLWKLSPSGELSASDRQLFDNLKSSPLGTLGNPNALATETDARVAAAAVITQNQQEVIIEGGAGRDIILGTETGVNKIYGGDGVDHVVAGGYVSEVYGGADVDFVQGGGFKSHLYGGEGTDMFGLAHHSFVMDATSEDVAVWGPWQVTGGFQQSWQEGGWAYNSPFTSLMALAPLPFLNTFATGFGAALVLLDTVSSLTFRFAQAEDDETGAKQLIVQLAGGRAGQAVIENYDLDLANGTATANIFVGSQVVAAGANQTIDELEKAVNIVLKSGFGRGTIGIDPLVLDLDGDGLELVRLDTSKIHFDLDGDGFAERAAWVREDDGLLARDLNANGVIDDITELFGDDTTPGFDALSALDSNADNKITSADTAFSELRVWRDLDQDGETDAGELQTLTEASITEISLASTETLDVIRGSRVRETSTFTRADSSTGTIGDVLLDAHQADSKYLGDTTVSTAAAALPQLKGFGNVVDLGVAMTDDATLLNLVSSFASLPATTSFADYKAAVDDILFRWAGVDGVAATAMGGGAFDQQKLAFLEAYYGEELTPRDGQGAPSDINVSELVDNWNDLLANLTARLAVQGPLQATLSTPDYDVAADRFTSTAVTSLADTYAAAIAQLPAGATAAEDDWNDNWGPILSELTTALIRHDGHDVRADFAVQSLIKALDGATSPLTLTQLVNGLGISGVQVGTSGADALTRTTEDGTQVYVGEGGNDTLTGGVGQDVYVFSGSFGNDTIIDSDGTIPMGDRIRFPTLTPDDVTMVKNGVDLVITVTATGDSVTVKDHFATPMIGWAGLPISSDTRVEEIQFADGAVFEIGDVAAQVGLGTSASETIEGSGTEDIIEGLQGDDILRGGDGGDSYFYSRGDGADTIQDVMTNPLINSGDTLYLLGLSIADVALQRNADSDDVTLDLGGGDSIMIENQFKYDVTGFQTKLSLNERVESFFFAQGPSWRWVDLQAATIATYTSEGDDTTYGFGTADTFYASAGNDTLIGLDGADTYHFGLGSGQDLIQDNSRYFDSFATYYIGFEWGSSDAVQFGEGINVTDVDFVRLGAEKDLFITVAGSTDTLTIEDQFYGQKVDLFDLFPIVWYDRIEEFRFADGTIITWEDVLADVTTGDAGDDQLYGAYYQDTLDGKAGNDYLSGENDGDTYIFGTGYGSDTIEDNQDNPLTTAPDTLKFTSELTVNDVTFSRDGATLDLLVSINGTSDVVRLKNQYEVLETGVFGPQAWDRIDLFEWADGTIKTWAEISQSVIDDMKTSGADTILGSHEDDIIDGGAGDDLLQGWNGSDIYLFDRGYGNDTVTDGADAALAPSEDKILFASGVLTTDVDVLRGAGEEVSLQIRDTGDTITITDAFVYSAIGFQANRIETVEFADGTKWDSIEVRARAIDSQETSGNDTIRGFFGDDTIEAVRVTTH